ncbi:MAG TPA: hypothetical protein VFI29_10740 [Hanamia sp.]|nr:hypothetical protein [Hanamia sp.]
MGLLIIIIFFIGIIVFFQISSTNDKKRQDALETERKKKDREIEASIAEITLTAKSAFNSKKFEECLKEIEKLQQYKASDSLFDLKLQCLICLKKFKTVIDLPSPYSDSLLYYRTKSLFESGVSDEASYCIKLAMDRADPEKFIQLLHSYIDPFENFEHFWKQLDKESRNAILSRINYEKFLTEYEPTNPKGISYGIKVSQVTLQDFLNLIHKDELDLSCLSGNGSFQHPITKDGVTLKNLGFLKYFRNLKVLNLRGQEKLVSAWGIDFNEHLSIVNLSDTSHTVTSLISNNLNKKNVRVFTDDREFENAKREFDPFWIKHKLFKNYLNFVSEKLVKQDYPQIFFPQCYFEDTTSFKEKLEPILPECAAKPLAIQGISEGYFKNYLVAEFGNKILLNQSLSLHKAYNPLYPDFVFREENLLVDIEIDEPYIYSSKLPTHYYKSDEGRNYQFIMRDWFVIRFSEEQVLKYPKTCILFLKSFLNSLDKVNPSELIEKETLKGLQFQHRFWTEDDCIQMAKNSYRDQFLHFLHG